MIQFTLKIVSIHFFSTDRTAAPRISEHLITGSWGRTGDGSPRYMKFYEGRACGRTPF